MNREEAIRFGNLIIEIASQCDDEESKHTVEFTELAVEALENQKTGHWEYVQYDSNSKIGNYHCSVCRHIIIPFENQKYCSNCGAKMEGENNGNS